MDAAARSSVRERAGGRCEYCLLPESALEQTFHIEHITAKQHGGDDQLTNLALACDRCNLYKGPNLSAVDPQSLQVVLLFHPRREEWTEHFRLNGAFIEGLSPVGRATVHLLRMNAPIRLRMREQWNAIAPPDAQA
ncbi:MAG: HNH endonuclease [Planctomycetia bacterium]|nr:HNH endonuclease [Planctomycetia bacterium]